MRELCAEELRFVVGGVLPVTPLPGITVRPDPGRNDTLPYSPPSTGGGSGGGGGGVPPIGGGAGGGLSVYVQAGIARIKAMSGFDLTYYALVSPTLQKELSLAASSYNFDFKWDTSSHTNWNDQVTGTIYIKSTFQNDALGFIQQVVHEMEHVAHRVSDRASETTQEVYINHYLETEGYATLANERVRNEILSNAGQDIRVAGAPGNESFYNAEYSHWATNQESYGAAAQNIGNYYGQHETTTVDGVTYNYHDWYAHEYHRLGGYQ